MGNPARGLTPTPSDPAPDLAKALAGFGAVGVTELWLFDDPAGRAALVVTRGDDDVRDAQVRRRLALVGVARAAFVPEDFPVTVARGTRLRPAPPPDNSPEAVRARAEAYRANLARMGVTSDEAVTPVSEEDFDAELRALGVG